MRSDKSRSKWARRKTRAKKMQRALKVTALSASLVVAAAPAHASVAHKCHEDQACFNWVTMGNHMRGVWTTGGRHLVVGPCRFQRLIRSGHYAPMNRYLSGDETATSVMHCHSTSHV